MSFRETHLPHFDPKHPTNFILVILIIIVGVLIVVALSYGITYFATRSTSQVTPSGASSDTTHVAIPTFTTDEKLHILESMATPVVTASSSVVKSNRPSVLQHVQSESTTSASERSKRLEILQQMQQ